MIPVPRAPLVARNSLLARMAPPVGAAEPRLTFRAGALVLTLPGRYSVTHLVVGDDALAAVDVGSVEDVPALLDAVRWLGRPLSQLRWIVVTHIHFDHLMGVDALAARTGARVAVSRRAFDAFQGGPPLRVPRGGRTTWHFLGGWFYQGLPFFAPADLPIVRRIGMTPSGNPFESPVEPLDDGQELPGLPGWTTVFTPGHSDDSHCLLHAGAGFLVAGDTVRNYLGGEWNGIQSDPDAYVGTRARLAALPVRTIFPGHGPVLDGEGIVTRLRVLQP